MENWELWSIACVLFGMAGYWGGVLQHGHTGPADGGLLINTSRRLFTSVTQAFISNSVANTTLMTYTIPANTVSLGGEIVIEGVFQFTNNTGGPQNEPDIDNNWNGGLVAALAGNTTAFATNPGPRPIMLRFIVTHNQAGQARVRGQVAVYEPSVQGITATIFKQLGGGLIAMDWTIDQVITLTVRNRVASANYETRHLSSFVDLR